MQITTINEEIQTNFEFDESFKMNFDQASNAILLNTMISMYSNPYVAVLREYCSNARDAHYEAGQTRPVEVSLPDEFSPALVVQDYGVGLDREGLKLFGTFGVSSKRDTNDLIGAFGAGSKSALSITSQFTVTAVKNNKKNTVIVKRDESGAPTMGFLPEQDTDEPNGVRIVIPTSERAKMLDAIRDGFFLGWEPGTLLIDGADPTDFQKANVHNPDMFTPMEGGVGWKINHGVERTSATLYQNVVVLLVNGVRYSLDHNQVENIPSNLVQGFLSQVVINVENGEVEMHPSRETLIYDKRTRTYLKNRIDAVVAVGKKSYQENIDKAKTFRKALQIREEALNYSFPDNFTWRGEKINLTSKYQDEIDRHDIDTFNFRITHVWFSSSFTNLNRISTSRSRIRYLEIVRRYSGLLRAIYNASETSVLVTGAPEVQDDSGYPDSAGALTWARETASQLNVPEKVNRFRMYFMQQTEDDLDEFFVQSFAVVVPFEEYQALVRKARSEHSRIARSAKKDAAAAVAEPVFRVVKTVRNYGDTIVADTPQSELDKTVAHVLIKNGAGPLEDDIRAALTTNAGYRRNGALVTLIAHLADSGKYAFVFANKGANTNNYPNLLPGYTTDIHNIIESEAHRITNSPSDLDKRIMIDKSTSAAFWVNGVVRSWVEHLPADLQQYVEAYRQGQAVSDGSNYLHWYRVISANSTYGLSQSPLQVNSSVPSPTEKYKLLNSFNFTRMAAEERDAFFEYLAYVDEASRQ